MSTKSRNIIPRVSIRLLCLVLVLMQGANACNSLTTETPLPFSFITELPKNEFLFIFVDHGSSCIDGLCECPVSEPPVYPFEFQDDKLILIQSFFDEVPTDWLSLRESRSVIALYGDYSVWDAHLQTFSSFPMTTPVGGFKILGVNQQGDIQIVTKGKYAIVANGSVITTTRPERVSLNCKVLHVYTLTNYGFIKDENVEFFW